MLDRDVLSPDDEGLLQLAIAIADGTPVDWSARTPSETERSSEDVTGLAVRLQQVERLVRGHRTLQTHQLQASSPTAHDTLLTEARRTSGAAHAEPSRVKWGPLIVFEKIGRGSFGDVYRAFDPRLDREVALKLIPERASAADTPAIEEGRLLARVRHPNVLTVYGAERIDGRVGIWTEYVRGETLADEVGGRGPLSAEEAARIGIEVCRALGAVHGAGLLHRDVKAQNVMRDADGRIVLGDFGTGVESDENAAVTEPQIAGTPLYLAPEVIQQSPATVATDLYSGGVLLYFLVTGDYPVRGRTFAEIRRAHAAGQCVPLGDARADLPGGFVTIVEALLARGPDRRYGSAAVVETALSEWLSLWRIQQDPPSSVDTPSREGPPSRRLTLGHAAAVALFVLTIAAAGAWLSRPARTTSAYGEFDRQIQQQALPPALATIDAETASNAPTDPETKPGHSPHGWLGFRPRDLLLVTRFENRTGDPVFDGALEYSFERELSNSDVIGLVQRDRVEDALGLMRRAAHTVVDQTVGREVALRDGQIKALLTGRIERVGTTYVLTAQLIDPAGDTVVAVLNEEAMGQEAILAAVHRQASRVRVSLGEQRDRMKGPDPKIDPASTRSLKAFQLYNEGYRLGLDSAWPAALKIARQVVLEDPEFGTGWTFLAWAVRESAAVERRLANVGAAPRSSAVEPPAPAEVMAEYRPYLDRALQLAKTAPDWELYWITASYWSLLGDDAKAVPFYYALLELRPDHYYGAANLINALNILRRGAEGFAVQRRIADQRPNDFSMNFATVLRLMEGGDLHAAKPYINRVLALLTPEVAKQPAVVRNASWLKLLPAYMAWEGGDVRRSAEVVAKVVREAATRPPQSPAAFWNTVASFYTTFGRMQDAAKVYEAHTPGQLIGLAYINDDMPAMRQHLLARGSSQGAPIPAVWFARAGLAEQAREVMDRPFTNPAGAKEITRGYLALLDGDPDAAIPDFRQGVALLRSGSVRQEFYLHCDAMATTYDRLGRKSEALQALENCAAARPLYRAAPVGDLSGFSWLKLRLHLADEYRETSRVAEAQLIEQDLRNLLVLADEDFPLLQQLKNRNQSRLKD